jgi:4'-phosphopantetheinyl transferase
MTRGIPDDTVVLWIARPGEAVHPDLIARYRALLLPDEAERAARFLFDRHRHEFLVTRALVRAALSEYRDVRPEAWRFVRNAYGRPAIDPPCGLQFNLSNTTSLVVCAVSSGRELGVDVEAVTRGPEILEVAATVFTDRERAELHDLDLSPAEDRALTLWTCKEAYMKARGLGMSLPPKQIDLHLDAGARPRIEVAPERVDGRAWALRTMDIHGHRVALCVESTPPCDLALDVREVVPFASEPCPTVVEAKAT